MKKNNNKQKSEEKETRKNPRTVVANELPVSKDKRKGMSILKIGQAPNANTANNISLPNTDVA